MVTMRSHRPAHPRPRSRNGPRRTMYDERSHSDDDRQSPRETNSYSPPQDRSRTPPRGPGGSYNHDSGRSQWRGNDSRRYDSRNRHGRSRSRSRSPRHSYRDRDHENYRSPRRRSRSPSQQRERRTLLKGPPSKDLIMEGIPVDMTEDDIKDELRTNYSLDGLEDVRVIRDRHTGVSRQFGFLQFTSVESSQDFLKTHGSEISLTGPDADPDSYPAKVRIANSRQPDDEWKCHGCKFSNFSTRSECFKCQEPKHNLTNRLIPRKPADFTNSGDQDVETSGTSSQYLIFRGLDPSVTESMLAKGAAKLYKSSTLETTAQKTTKVISTTSDNYLGAKIDTIVRVLLVRDRQSDESWCFGFVEFKTAEDAQAAITKFNAQERYTIASKPVMVNFIHTGVFVPAWNYGPDKQKFTFTLFANPATKLAYWDQEAYANELVVQAEAPKPNESAGIRGSKSKADAESKSKKRKGETAINGSSDGPQQSSKKTAPAHLQFWSNRHAELHGIESSKSSKEGSDTASNGGAAGAEGLNRLSSIVDEQSWAHRESLCCFLCRRQFQTDAEVNRHERLSPMHQANLSNDAAKARALRSFARRRIARESESAYRDRAHERRQAFNQPKQPAPQVHPTPRKGDSSNAKASTPSTTTPALPQSKGAALLGKMGWTAGKGLGAQGTGVTEAVTSNLYAQGVGLGAKGGKLGDAVEEAGRQTRGDYGEFVNKVKDKTKERFESL
ncbi:MAG: hypothetical protein M1814_005654 [Vezdaea aestivalis]|nr:MAG: hypothetical protein M1814_005654 [Vezdaea aestivalis]